MQFFLDKVTAAAAWNRFRFRSTTLGHSGTPGTQWTVYSSMENLISVYTAVY